VSTVLGLTNRPRRWGAWQSARRPLVRRLTTRASRPSGARPTHSAWHGSQMAVVHSCVRSCTHPAPLWVLLTTVATDSNRLSPAILRPLPSLRRPLPAVACCPSAGSGRCGPFPGPHRSLPNLSRPLPAATGPLVALSGGCHPSRGTRRPPSPLRRSPSPDGLLARTLADTIFWFLLVSHQEHERRPPPPFVPVVAVFLWLYGMSFSLWQTPWGPPLLSRQADGQSAVLFPGLAAVVEAPPLRAPPPQFEWLLQAPSARRDSHLSHHLLRPCVPVARQHRLRGTRLVGRWCLLPLFPDGHRPRASLYALSPRVKR